MCHGLRIWVEHRQALVLPRLYEYLSMCHFSTSSLCERLCISKSCPNVSFSEVRVQKLGKPRHVKHCFSRKAAACHVSLLEVHHGFTYILLRINEIYLRKTSAQSQSKIFSSFFQDNRSTLVCPKPHPSPAPELQ